MTDDRRKILIALKKARSNLDRTIAALERADASASQCFAVLQQNRAVIGLLQSANRLVLARHIADVLAQCTRSPRQAAALRAELVRVITAAQK